VGTGGGTGDWAELYRREDTAAGYDRRFRGPRRRLNNLLVWRATARALRELAGGRLPRVVVDAPAGTGRFTARLRAGGNVTVHVDRSPAMLRQLRRHHGPGLEVVGDLRQPPLEVAEGVVLCLRLMQHLDAPERVATLAGLRHLAPRAVVAYYPGWHYKHRLRRLRHRVGLPHGTLRPRLSRTALAAEAQAAGWNLRAIRPVLPLLSESVLLLLEDPEARP